MPGDRDQEGVSQRSYPREAEVRAPIAAVSAELQRHPEPHSAFAASPSRTGSDAVMILRQGREAGRQQVEIQEGRKAEQGPGIRDRADYEKERGWHFADQGRERRMEQVQHCRAPVRSEQTASAKQRSSLRSSGPSWPSLQPRRA